MVPNPSAAETHRRGADLRSRDEDIVEKIDKFVLEHRRTLPRRIGFTTYVRMALQLMIELLERNPKEFEKRLRRTAEEGAEN